MRSVLLSFNPDLFSSLKCAVCSSLGYLQVTPQSENSLVNQILATNQIHTEELLFHFSIKEKPFFEQIKKKLNNKKLRFVACQGCLNAYKAHENHELAVIFFDMADLKKSISKKNRFRHYFLITAASLLSLQELDETLKKQVRFFYKPDMLNEKNSLPVAEVLSFFQIHGRDLHYELPFGHDQIDGRNPFHLEWILNPYHTFSSTCGALFPELSIVIPFYNRREMVLKVLDSLRHQLTSFEKFEIILLDDGSDHKSLQYFTELLKKETLLNIHYHYIKREVALSDLFIGNRVGPVRNLGAWLAKGKILLFLDSDILLPSEYIEKILQYHETNDVVLPRRVYLNEISSEGKLRPSLDFTQEDFMEAPWEKFMNKIFSDKKWDEMEHPWKYFMTYCLSIKKDLFIRTGGFRTNFISYGYEDIDLGYRVAQLTKKYISIPLNVYHLYHFNRAAEYDLESSRRYFQLMLSARMFTSQNMPRGEHDLEKMITPRTKEIASTENRYKIMWRLNHFKMLFGKYLNQFQSKFISNLF